MAPGSDEDDDYMNMTFAEPEPAKESSVKRAERLKKESRARGIIKSKAQLEEEEAAAREKALSTSLLENERAKKSKGFAMMAKMGFTGGGLGKKTDDGSTSGRAEPIKVEIKGDRGGIGMDNEKKRKVGEAAEESGVKAVKLDPDEYRERVRKEREEARMEKQFYAAQRMAERLDDEQPLAAKNPESPGGEDVKSPKVTSTTDAKSRPLKSIPVLYRGLIRHREEQERDRRMRHDLEQSLSRLPTYEDEDEDDEDHKTAMGKRRTVYATADDLDEEDPELDAFNELDYSEKLEQLLVYLRSKHRYCFWCKTTFPDDDMEGCPGISEEDHD
ncbi:g-patch domain-containing protein [Sarocladium implicatum]|nr:g-patch domain-containing protein [Sarocladium implicatum]